MKKAITLTFLLFACLHSSLKGQSVAKDIQKITPDSCYVVISKVVTKEMTLPSQEPSQRVLAKLKLPHKDIEALLEKSSKKSSYQGERALLTHSNVAFRFYKADTIYSSLNLSTYTGNIEIHNLITEEHFFDRASDKLSHYLIGLFKKLEVWELIDPFDKQGLGSSKK